MTFFNTLTNPVVGYSFGGRQRWHCRAGFQESILACNNGAERMYGWTECEAQKMTVDKLIPRQRRKAEKAFIDNHSKRAKP